MLRKLYIAASSQHVGKTTSTLGLIAAFRQRGHNVGYCKPVGQEIQEFGGQWADKDAHLFAKVMGFPLNTEIHSPVMLSQGVTSAFLDNPASFDFSDRIRKAAAYLEAQHELVIYEGTGHPGVGSVVNLSNADVAKMLDAPVVLIVEGGIGNTIDRVSLCLSQFKEKGVPVIGVIVNKVFPEKMDRVRHYVGMKLAEMGLPILGILHYEKSLSFPIIQTVLEAVQGRVLANEENLDNRMEDFLSGSLVDTEKLLHSQNLLLIVSPKRIFSAIQKIQEITLLHGIEETPISGIIVTGDGLHEIPVKDYSRVFAYVDKYKIPVLATPFDPLGSVIKISKIEVKINARTPWKADQAVALIGQYVDLDAILSYKMGETP
ncbi:MAG: AAA family ATPase [Saprospirales bacterium]|nr:AAA family ATPase [Saprospirales bacterium]